MSESQVLEPSFRLPRKIHEHHGNDVTAMPIAAAGHDHAVKASPVRVGKRLHFDGHLRPLVKGILGAEFNPVGAEPNGIRSQRKLRFARANFDRRENAGSIELARTHT